MISSVEVSVRELAHKVSINERRIDDLEQYSRSNCLIMHGYQNVPAKATNEVFESFVLNQGCATHGPRATIRPSRPVNVALDDGRTKNFF